MSIPTNNQKTRKSELFEACKPDNHYIFSHEEYDWDDIVNAFIAGGLYADCNPVLPWKPITEDGKWTDDVSNYATYECCNVMDGKADIIDGEKLLFFATVSPTMYTHFRRFEYPL